ncbi:MAG TPA: hypothetical protein VMK12_20195, partial [Anaeromyxobacteraceae bacterium]|nr:hypothetical protein [Anaeromyxobacteraceae bacterium]
ERQTKGLYDVLICGHSVPAATDNTYRKARACPECRVRVQEYADAHVASQRAPRGQEREQSVPARRRKGKRGGRR